MFSHPWILWRSPQGQLGVEARTQQAGPRASPLTPPGMWLRAGGAGQGLLFRYCLLIFFCCSCSCSHLHCLLCPCSSRVSRSRCLLLRTVFLSKMAFTVLASKCRILPTLLHHSTFKKQNKNSSHDYNFSIC